MEERPILWSFRRCPYAIRARLAVRSAGVEVELREILLRDKPEAFLATSPSATVPALRLTDRVLDESLDIMIWALEQNDPQGLLDMPQPGWTLIEANDGPFKTALDHTKYATRYPELEIEAERAKAGAFLHELNEHLETTPWLTAADPKIADLAIIPFVRQFANIDRSWFDAQGWTALATWLDGFISGSEFAATMIKFNVWQVTNDPVSFGTNLG